MADPRPNLKVTRHRRYVKSYHGNNNNKYWYITEFEDESIYVEFGRIGKTAQSKLHAPGKKDFDKLCRSKEKGKKDEPGYRQLDVVDAPSDTTTTSSSTTAVSQSSLATVAAKQIAGGDKTVEDLVKYLAKQNIHTILKNTTMTYNDATGLFSTPCGVVTQVNIDEARTILSDMRDYVEDEDWGSSYIGKLEDFLMLIPQEVKNMRDIPAIIPDTDAVQKQNDILDSLQASLDQMANQPATKKKKTKENDVFKVTLGSVKDAATIKRVNKMFTGSINRSHSCSHLKLKKVFSVDIEEMRKRFDKSGKPVGNVKQLWHGTRVANVLSILHKGLIIPSSSASHCTGRMFGDGLYFSDQSTKSLNYSYGYWGGSRDDSCMMFVADVAMGREFIPSGSGRNFPRPGYDSTFAKGRQSGVGNNEMIIYKLAQCNLVYLCQFGR